MFGITKRPVRLSAQERATLRINAENAAELRKQQFDITSRINGGVVTHHYLRLRTGGIRLSSITVD